MKKVKEAKVANEPKKEKAPKADKSTKVAATAVVPTKKKSKLTLKSRNALLGYLFILPWILGLLIFTIWPFIYSIQLSLSEVKITPNGIQTSWQGLTQYVYLLTKDTQFPMVLGQDIISIVLSSPMIVIAALIIALLLNTKVKGRTFFRAVFFLPVIIISGPVMNKLIGNGATTIIEPTKYFVYQFLDMLPFGAGSPILYVFDNMVTILWFSGVQVLIFLAGIQKIDHSIFEAASIDGASSWQIFWEVILPFVRPLILINTIYTIVEMSSMPTSKINAIVRDRMFVVGTVYNQSAAAAWIYFLVILAIVGIAFLLLKEKKPKRRVR